MMIDEEQEVEHLLEHQSPSTAAVPSQFYSQPTSHMSPASSFATTDPFYAVSAQTQQSFHFMAPQSAFLHQSQN